MISGFASWAFVLKLKIKYNPNGLFSIGWVERVTLSYGTIAAKGLVFVVVFVCVVWNTRLPGFKKKIPKNHEIIRYKLKFSALIRECKLYTDYYWIEDFFNFVEIVLEVVGRGLN